VQSECLPNVRSNILSFPLESVQEWNQLHQFIVRLVHEPRLDGNSILQLVAKGLWRVVDDDSLPEVSAQDIEVLDVVSVDTNTVLTEQSILDPLSLRIQQIHQLVCVNLFAGGEKNELVLLAHSLQKLRKPGSGSHKYLILLVLEDDREGECCILQLLQGTVNKGLIQV